MRCCLAAAQRAGRTDACRPAVLLASCAPGPSDTDLPRASRATHAWRRPARVAHGARLEQAAMSSGALRRRTYMGINPAHGVSPDAAAIVFEPCTTRSGIDR